MIISALDQLVVIADGDNYASAMGVVYPSNGGNAQYFSTDANGKVIAVQPTFSNADGKRLIFFPIMFSATENKYLSPTGVITFRVNNRTSSDAIIAQGAMTAYQDHTAVPDGKVWSTAEQGLQQSYRDVFYATTHTITNPDGTSVTVPALAVIGQPAYRIQQDIDIYCSCDVDEFKLESRNDIEIRSMAADNYKVVISAVNQTGSNDQVINTASETINLTANVLKNGSSEGVTGATFLWHKFGESGISMQNGSSYSGARTNQTLTVTDLMVSGVAEFVCEVNIGNSIYKASITIHDIQDEYMLDKGRTVYESSNSNNVVENSGILKPNFRVVYKPSVVVRRTGAAYTGGGAWTYDFVVKNAAGTTVAALGASGLAQGVAHTILASAVKQQGGVTVMISANNSSI